MEKLGSPEPAHPSPGAGPVAGVPVAKAAGVEGDEGVAEVSSKLFRCACVRRWLPLVYREELYQVLRLTGPLVSRGKLKWWWGYLVCNSWSTTTVIHSVTVFLCSRITIDDNLTVQSVQFRNIYAECKRWNKMASFLYVSANTLTILLSNLKLLCWVEISCLNPVNSKDLLHQLHLINGGLQIRQIYLFVSTAAVSDSELPPAVCYHHILWSHWQCRTGWICAGLSGTIFTTL